jgi:hypothetical protein
VHVALFAAGVDAEHNSQQWCDQIIRITPQLGLPPIKAAPVKPRRINGEVLRRPLDGHLSRGDIAHWPHSIRLAGFYDRGGRVPGADLIPVRSPSAAKISKDRHS